MRRRYLLATGASILGGGWISRATAAIEPGVTDHEIVFGQSAVLNGPLGVAVREFNAGAGLAFDAVNAQGGIRGRRIRLVSLDDGLKPDVTVANYKSLLQEHRVFAFFGGVGSGTIAAVTPLLRQSNAPLIGNYALSDAVRENAKGAAYFVRASYGREAEKLVEHLATIGINRIAVAHLANPGGEEVLTLLRRAAAGQSKPVEIVGSAAVKNDGSNVKECAEALARTRAQTLIMFLSGPPVAELMSTLWRMSVHFSFYGMSVIAGDQVAKALTGNERLHGLVISQVVPYPWSDADQTASGFRARCDAGKVDVGYSSYEGYLNAGVLIEALRRAGPTPTRSGLHAAMRGMKARIGDLDVDFTTGRESGSRYVDLVHVRADGRFVR